MDNKDIAAVFQQIAQILEIKGGNPFRIRSFQRSAQIIEDLAFNASEAIADDVEQLRSISGIGEGTISKIREIVETGSCAELRKLNEEIPPTLLDLLKVQGLGPKKVSLFWKKLGVQKLSDLEKAARAGRLQGLPGVGAKSEKSILRAVENLKQRQGRFRLDKAIEIAESILAHLQKHAPVKRIAAAGSLRRRRETVGDIDILAAGGSPDAVVEAFLAHPEINETAAHGPTKTSVRLRNGMSCDLRVLDDDSFGAALQYFTGSKAHNVVLRERAKRKGFKISEYGLFRIEDEKKVAGRGEEEIYRILGLDYVPPELRENRGEIEAAESGLPKLLEPSDLRGDLHLHTLASDGKSSLEEMAEAAIEMGYEYIAVTDHSKALAMTGGLDEERLAAQTEDVDAFNAGRPGIAVLKGIEVDILADGQLDLSDEALAPLDVVVAAVHSRLDLGRREMTERICKALRHPAVNILAHPTGRILLRREGYGLDIEEVLQCARDHGVALEINSLPKRLDLSDVQCRMARDMGVLISVNSDSHHRNALANIRYGVFTARRGWLGPGDVINTFPLSKLRKFLKKELDVGEK